MGLVEEKIVNGAKYTTINLPKDNKGRFIDTGIYDEQMEEHLRQTAMVMAFYSEGGRNFDPNGAHYLCGGVEGKGPGGCNKYRPGAGTKGTCVGVQGKISGDTGSCQFWENLFNGDHELEYPEKHKWDKVAAGYGERPEKGVGFGCMRCEYGNKAKAPDSLGRALWCGMHGCRVRENACCSKNERPGDIHFDDSQAFAVVQLTTE